MNDKFTLSFIIYKMFTFKLENFDLTQSRCLWLRDIFRLDLARSFRPCPILWKLPDKRESLWNGQGKKNNYRCFGQNLYDINKIKCDNRKSKILLEHWYRNSRKFFRKLLENVYSIVFHNFIKIHQKLIEI